MTTRLANRSRIRRVRVKFQGDGVANEKDCADLRVDFGGISAGMMLLTMPFADRFGFDKGEILGYNADCAVGAAGVFCGKVVPGKRERGRPTFARGFAVAILIAVPTTHVTALVVWRIRLSLP